MTASGVPDYLRHVVTEECTLWRQTSMRIGGPARWLARPSSESDLAAILGWIQTQQLPYMILGGGTNVLFPDDGFPGVVAVTSQLKGIGIDSIEATAACGESLSSFAQRLNRVGLTGMEWACGIPGTIGGAVAMSAGAFGGDIASSLSRVRLLTADGAKELSVEQLELGYRTSALVAGKLAGVVVEATFMLQQADPQHCLNREREVLETRHRTQPMGASSGCIFKNPTTGPTAGELLDRAGCKGMRVGHAVVSSAHANFIINESENNAEDVLGLIQRMKQRVIEVHGIVLELEVVLPGSELPL
ncbi:UDP-N-acetylmuramate dehydrogenase [Candidatus Bipolaricaulota bacterium]